MTIDDDDAAQMMFRAHTIPAPAETVYDDNRVCAAPPPLASDDCHNRAAAKLEIDGKVMVLIIDDACRGDCGNRRVMTRRDDDDDAP